MNQNNPRVSICIPTYNRAHMVRPTIESALAQKGTDIEIIVVDDGSTDTIEEVVASYDDPRLRFVKNPKNVGQFANFNRCIEIARGEFLHILHSDDSIDPHFTETCVRFFDEHPEVYLTFTSEVKQSPENSVLNCYADSDRVMPAPEGFRQLLLHGCFISCPSVMTRRSVYDTVGGYSYEYPIAADFYQWLKISRKLSIGFVKDATVYYHEGMHSESYRFFIHNPVGYLDRVKIVLQTITDVKDDYHLYVPEINHQLYILTFKFLMISCIWRDPDRRYHPSFFIGLAHFSHSIIQPQSFPGHLKKMLTHFLITLFHMIILIYPFKMVIQQCILPYARKKWYMSGTH